MSAQLVTTDEPIQLFEALDAQLAQHPFGNSDYITQQLHVAYKRRLGKIAPHLPVAGQLLEALSSTSAYGQYRVIGDTVVRCAVQHSMKQIETGTPYGLPLEQCKEVFEATISHLGDGNYGPLGSGLLDRLEPEENQPWIWSEERADDVFSRAFRYLVRDNYAEGLITPGPDEVVMLTRGARLLRELLPMSSRSALTHTHLIGVFPQTGTWTTRASSSEFRLSGTIFLSCKLLANPWWVAEHLFHESLHQQLYDFRHGHLLLDENFEREGAPTICSLWNVPDSSRGNYWDIHRALAAFHVYVHLALLAAVAELRANDLENAYGPFKMVTGTRTALARAHYLGEQIRLTCWQELGPAGKRLVDWFTAVLEILDPSPPPPGAYIHLVLDRYWREAMDVELLLRKPEQRSDLSVQLMALAKDEVADTQTVLAELDATADLSQFADSLGSFSNEEPGAQFVLTRRLIARTLLSVSPDGYRLSDSGAPDEIVKQMIDKSSESLMSVSRS